MKNRIVVMIMAAVISLPAMAGWIKHQQKNCTEEQNAFQTTSTMQGAGSTYSATPTALDENGSAVPPSEANASFKAITGKRRIEVYVPTTDPNAPIGDAVLPMMLMAAAAAGAIALRRRKALVDAELRK